MTLKEYLATKAISESEFAEKIGVKQATVNRYCNGHRTPLRRILRAIAEKTDGNVTANDFVGAE